MSTRACGLGYGRFVNTKLVSIEVQKGISMKEILQESEKILKSLANCQLSPNERQEIIEEEEDNSSEELKYAWFCLRDDQGFFFLAACEEGFPESQAFKLINSLQEEFRTLSKQYGELQDETLIEHSKKAIPEILKSPDSQNKFEVIHNKIASTQKELQINLNSIIQNTDNLEKTSQMSEKLKRSSVSLRTQSEKTKKIMCCINCKWTIIIALVIIAIVAAILLSIYL